MILGKTATLSLSKLTAKLVQVYQWNHMDTSHPKGQIVLGEEDNNFHLFKASKDDIVEDSEDKEGESVPSLNGGTTNPTRVPSRKEVS